MTLAVTLALPAVTVLASSGGAFLTPCSLLFSSSADVTAWPKLGTVVELVDVTVSGGERIQDSLRATGTWARPYARYRVGRFVLQPIEHGLRVYDANHEAGAAAIDLTSSQLGPIATLDLHAKDGQLAIVARASPDDSISSRPTWRFAEHPAGLSAWRLDWLTIALTALAAALLIGAGVARRHAARWFGKDGIGTWQEGMVSDGWLVTEGDRRLQVQGLPDGPRVFRMEEGAHHRGVYREGTTGPSETIAGTKAALRRPFAARVGYASAALVAAVVLLATVAVHVVRLPGATSRPATLAHDRAMNASALEATRDLAPVMSYGEHPTVAFARSGRRALYMKTDAANKAVEVGVSDNDDNPRWRSAQYTNPRWSFAEADHLVWSDSGATYAFWARTLKGEAVVRKNDVQIPTEGRIASLSFLPGTEDLRMDAGAPASPVGPAVLAERGSMQAMATPSAPGTPGESIRVGAELSPVFLAIDHHSVRFSEDGRSLRFGAVRKVNDYYDEIVFQVWPLAAK